MGNPNEKSSKMLIEKSIKVLEIKKSIFNKQLIKFNKKYKLRPSLFDKYKLFFPFFPIKTISQLESHTIFRTENIKNICNFKCFVIFSFLELVFLHILSLTDLTFLEVPYNSSQGKMI